MKVLVTGGTGFLGTCLVDKLCTRGYDVVILSRQKTIAGNEKRQRVKIHTGDLTDKKSLFGIDSDFDYIFHLATARDSVGQEVCHRINIDGTKNLLEIVREKNIKPKKFVYVSSLGVTGLSHSSIPKKEGDPLEPVSCYGIAKKMAEQEIMNVGENLPYIILRPAKIYGPGDKRILIHFKLVRWGIIPQLGIKPRFISLCYVEDLAEAMILAAESGRSNSAYFFSDGEYYSWNDFYYAIAAVLGKKIKKIFIPQFTSDVFLAIAQLVRHLPTQSIYLEPNTFIELKSRYWLCDPAKFFNEFSYKPRFRLAEGIRQTAEWFTKNNLM